MGNQPAPAQKEDLAEAEVNAIRDPELVDKRRNQILDGALALFLEKGFASTTIRDICAKSGVNQASLYDYVANKQDILRRAMNRVWFRRKGGTLGEKMAAATSDEAFEAAVMDYYRREWNQNREGILLAYRAVPHLTEDDRQTLREREERVLQDLSRHLRAHCGLADDDPRPRIIANLLIFMHAFGPFRDWLMRGIDEEEVERTVARAIRAIICDLAKK